MTEAVRLLLIWLGLMSVLAFLLFGWDKLMAKIGHSRIPEIILWGITAFGGGTGALFGMLLFRHKIRKHPFPLLIPLLCIIQLILLWLVYAKHL